MRRATTGTRSGWMAATAMLLSGVGSWAVVPSFVAAAEANPLHLLGTGTRYVYRQVLLRELRVPVYSAELRADSGDATDLINGAGRLQLRLRFLRNVTAAQLREQADACFAALARQDAGGRFSRDRAAFVALFAGRNVRTNDEVLLNFTPQRVEVLHNGRLAGAVDGTEFQRLVRRIWLGDQLADPGLEELRVSLVGR